MSRFGPPERIHTADGNQKGQKEHQGQGSAGRGHGQLPTCMRKVERES
jgi:hypothetical protein